MQTRLENLREQLDKTVDELLELQALEEILGDSYHHDSQPRIELRRLALLEAQRVNLSDAVDYSDNCLEDHYSSLNQSFAELVENSVIHPKSFRLITKQHQEVGKDVLLSWNFYHVFPPKSPKISWDDWSVQNRGIPLAEAYEGWLNYGKSRKNEISCCHKAIVKMIDLATSAIYDGISVHSRQHHLQNGIYLKESDKTLQFYFPFHEFRRFAAPVAFIEHLKFVKASFILPAEAHERSWFFTKKGAHYYNFMAFLTKQNIMLPNSLQSLLVTHSNRGEIRYYREKFEQSKQGEKIRAYFVSAKNAYAGNILETLRKEIREQSLEVGVNHVWPKCSWYPEWMKKLGGIVVQPELREYVTVPHSSYDVWHYKINQGSFSPSSGLCEISGTLSKSQFHDRYLQEMRQLYRRNPIEFQQQAQLYCQENPIIGYTYPHNYGQALDKILRQVNKNTQNQHDE